MPKVSLLVRVSFCFLFLFLPLDHMDDWFYDRFFAVRGRRHRPTPVVLVVLDDATLPASPPKVNWPLPLGPQTDPPARYPVWDVDRQGRLLEALFSHGPRVVAFATYFGEVEPKGSEVELPENLVLPATFTEDLTLLPPPPELSDDASRYGFVNLFPDQDQVIRQTRLSVGGHPSLGLLLSFRWNDAAPKVPSEARESAEGEDGTPPTWLDFRGPAGSFPTYSARDVLRKQLPEGALRGKAVLIGRRETAFQGVSTPFGWMSRLEVQANVADTLLGDRAIRHLPGWVSVAFGAAAIVLSVLIIVRFPLHFAWVCLVALAVGFLSVGLLFFSYFKVWAGMSNAIVCIFGTHLLMMGYKLGRQEEEQRRLETESEHLREMDQFKNNFISLFSHDLKTPIAKIRAITERLMASATLDEPMREGLRNIERASGELGRRISDILKVTRMETMSLEPTKGVVDLNRLVEGSVSRHKFLADEKGIDLVLDLEPLFSMEGDQQLIEEVITNLVENAIKYSPAGKKVIIRTREQEDEVVVSVIDEGPGIPAEEIPRVTGKFYRGKQASLLTKGSGLGLYLSKYFVELHGGKLSIKSEVGRGTEVAFSLPLPT